MSTINWSQCPSSSSTPDSPLPASSTDQAGDQGWFLHLVRDWNPDRSELWVSRPGRIVSNLYSWLCAVLNELARIINWWELRKWESSGNSFDWLQLFIHFRNKISVATTAKLLLGVVISAFGLVFVIFVMKCKFKIGFQMNMCYYLWSKYNKV